MGDRTGSLNKNKVFLLKRLKDMYGEDFDPIMRAAELVDKMHKQVDDKPELIPVVVDKWLKVAEFTNGKVAALQLSQDPENPLFTRVEPTMSLPEAARAYKESLKSPSVH